MRSVLTALLLAALLIVAACEDGTDPDAGETAETAETAETGDPDVAEPTSDEGSLEPGVAATVNGSEIPAEEVDNRMAAAEEDPEFAGALEGEEGEMLAAQFRAQTLSVLVQTRIVLDAAERMDVAPTEDDIEQTRSEIFEQFGSEEEFEEAFEASGMSRESLEDQLRSVAALDVVGRTLVEEGEVPEPPEGAEGVDPEELAVQQWLGDQLAQADVVVDPAYGEWNAEAGQVMPEQMPPPAAELEELPTDGEDGGEPTP